MSFEITDLEQWLIGAKLTKEGADFLRRVVTSPPQRAVATNVARNVASHYPSRTMQQTTQSESWTAERLLLIELEYDPTVVAFWDQPPAVPIAGTRRDGKPYRSAYTADYLVLFGERAVAYEMKPRSEAEILVKERPSDWLAEDGRYVYRPAKLAYEQFGICHVVKCAEDFSQVRVENLSLMLRTRNVLYPKPPTKWHRKVMQCLKKDGAMRISDLLLAVGTVDISPVVAMIDSGELFTRLDRYRLCDPQSAWVAASEEDICRLDDAPTSIFSFRAADLSDERAPTSKQINIIAQRLAALNAGHASPLSRTTLWRYEKALANSNGDPLALKSRIDRCGHRGSRLDPKHEAMINSVLLWIYSTPNGPSCTATYSMYCAFFQRRSLQGRIGFAGKPVCLATFHARIESLNCETVARARGGKRAANAVAKPSDPLLRALGPGRAFARAHLDHWLCDLYSPVRISESTVYASRAYVTFLVDSEADFLLAMAIGFEAPSRRTISRVLRECARLHGRLPEIIVTDSGAEFRSNFFHEVLAELEIELARRPVASGRWGQEVERVFGVFKTQVLAGLPGYLASTKSDRSVSRSFRSDQHATIDVIDLHRHLERFRVEWFNAHPRGKQQVAPTVLLREGLLKCSVSGNPVKVDEAFLIATAVPLLRKSYRIDGARGLRAQDRHYSASGPDAGSVFKIDEIRADPEDLSVIYAHSAGRWVPMYSGDALDASVSDRLQVLYAAARHFGAVDAIKAAAVDSRAALGELLLDTRRDVASTSERVEPGDHPDQIKPSQLAIYLDKLLGKQTSRSMIDGD